MTYMDNGFGKFDKDDYHFQGSFTRSGKEVLLLHSFTRIGKECFFYDVLVICIMD